MECPGESHSWRELHPLENPLILSHLFNICPPSLLKTCRLVCHQWLKISMPIWRTSFCLKFTKDVYTGYVMDQGKGLEDLSLQDFLAYVESLNHEYGSQPHRRFSLGGWNFGRAEEELPLFQRFWAQVAPSVTKLELVSCTFTDAVAFRKIIFQQFPRLRQLCFNNCTIRSRLGEKNRVEDSVYGEHISLRSLSLSVSLTSPRDFPVPFLELFGHFPWITSFEYMGPRSGKDDYKNLTEFLNIIKTIRQSDKMKFPLQHFKCMSKTIEIGEESRPTLALLGELRIPLECLHIMVTPDMDDIAVETILGVHKDAIRKLCVMKATHHICSSWIMPITEKLSILREITVKEKLLENMDFLQFTPYLEKLGIYDFRSRVDPHHPYSPLETTIVSRSCKEKMPGVKLLQLKHFSLDYVVSDEDVQELVQWMPNVHTLAMILNGKQFEVVCRILKNVEDLRLQCGSAVLTDEMVCGRRFPQVVGAAALEEVGRYPNITNLKYLKTIQFGVNSLTDVSVFGGFLLLPKLTQIVAPVKFGDEARISLRDKNVRPFSI